MAAIVTEPEHQSAGTPRQTSSLQIEPMRQPVQHGWRVFIFFSAVILLTGFVSLLFADLLWRTGWSPSRTVLLVLFIILFLLMAVGCMQALFGFVLRIIGDNQRITKLAEYKSRNIDSTSTAIIFPVYNEDVIRVCEGLRATYESLEKTGNIEHFDFFILSDSTDPDKWVDEERHWFKLVRDLDALGRIYYRRRFFNDGKKCGNVRDFLSSWGRRYRYFVVGDADSVMRGETLVDLVKLMEAHPQVGLIQTVPELINATSLFGRMQQFANRFYAPIFITGLNYWAQNFGNYWGHNAIIRTEPFMNSCDLPQLPGRKPFGGQILSHDFVEAALMLKDNWEVWMAYDLEGSYEEAPQGLIENAQRDRRWCQGNLQHTMVVFAHGLYFLSRVHLLLGIFGYLAGPLWLAFLITFNWMRWSHELTGLSDITTPGHWLQVSGTVHALIVFTICMGVLMLPKLLAIIDLAKDRKRREEFSGLPRTVTSVILETAFSTLHAPLQMLWHTKFVITNLLGITVGWGAQKRAADGTSWSYAIQRHWGHVLIGIVWGGAVLYFDPTSFWWFFPVVAGMVLSIPISVFTSRSSWGVRSHDAGLFLTPEETTPPPEIVSLRKHLISGDGEVAAQAKHFGIVRAVLDPYINAIHVSLLREKRFSPHYTEIFRRLDLSRADIRELGERLLTKGPDALNPGEELKLLCDAEIMSWAHQQVWLRPDKDLAPAWMSEIRAFSQ